MLLCFNFNRYKRFFNSYNFSSLLINIKAEINFTMREILLSLTVLLFVAIMVACSDGLPEEFSAPDFVLKDVFTGKNNRN